MSIHEFDKMGYDESSIISDYVTSHQIIDCILLPQNCDVIASIHVEVVDGCQHTAPLEQFGRVELIANDSTISILDKDILSAQYTNGENIFRMNVGILATCLLRNTKLHMRHVKSDVVDTCHDNIRKSLSFMCDDIANIVMSYTEHCQASTIYAHIRNNILDYKKRCNLLQYQRFRSKTIVAKKYYSNYIEFTERATTAIVVKGKKLRCFIHNKYFIIDDLHVLRRVYGVQIRDNEIFKPAKKTVQMENGSMVVAFEQNLLVHKSGVLTLMWT